MSFTDGQLIYAIAYESGLCASDTTAGDTVIKTGANATNGYFAVHDSAGSDLVKVLGNTGAVTITNTVTADEFTTSSKGAVTQLTSITTGVTSNASSGKETTVSSTLAAQASASFTVTNSYCGTASIVLASVQSYTGTGTVGVEVNAITAGTFDLVLTNTSGSTLDSTIIIGFMVV